MDAYSVYNKIKISRGDTCHTTFYADNDIYHYTGIPVGLINVNAIYQRMVNKLFSGMVGVTMEAYVDDMLVKYVKGVDHTENLRKTFERMKLHQVRLNSAKCAFGVQSMKFLGYMVSQRGLEVNLERLNAFEGIKNPTCHTEVQNLNGRLMTLNRFFAKARDKSLPLFQVLRAPKKFEWTSECDEAFQDLKEHLLTVPPLAKPEKGDALVPCM